MEKILTRGQELLAEYLSEIGMPFYAVTYLVMLVWEEEATREMLLYLLETHSTNYDEIVNTAKKLSIKYPLQDDDDDYND